MKNLEVERTGRMPRFRCSRQIGAACTAMAILAAGASIRLGVAAAPLRRWGTSIYALVGLRRINGTFSTRFNGCLSPMPCSSAPDTPDFVSGTDARKLDFDGITLGIGLERRLRQRVAVRLELRHTRYGDRRWVAPFDDVGVTVPTAVGTEQSALMVSLARTY